MAFMEVHVYSRALGHQIAFNALISQKHPWHPPEELPRRVLYLLHGMGDDHTGWMRLTGIERYTMDHNFAVIMPSTNLGFYTDMAGSGPRYWEYVSQELPELCRELLGVEAPPELTFAAGLSMGGYGALKLGLRQPERFRGIAALSAAPISRLMAQAQLKQLDNPELMHLMRRVFGDEITPENDLFALAQGSKECPRKPDIYMACGDADYLYPLNTALRDTLTACGHAVQWHEHAKFGHTWDYWDARIEDVIQWILTLDEAL